MTLHVTITRSDNSAEWLVVYICITLKYSNMDIFPPPPTVDRADVVAPLPQESQISQTVKTCTSFSAELLTKHIPR